MADPRDDESMDPQVDPRDESIDLQSDPKEDANTSQLQETKAENAQGPAPFVSSASPIKPFEDRQGTPNKAESQRNNVNGTQDTAVDSSSQFFQTDLEALGLLAHSKSEDGSSVGSNQTGVSTTNEGYKLYDDIYGLIYFANPTNQAFWFAVIVFVIQISLLLLVFFDMVQVGVFESVDTTNGIINRIALPVRVPISVTIAQFLGLILSVMMVASEGDLTRGLSKIWEGFNYDILEEDPDATYESWIMGAILQAFAGVVLAADLVVLLLQSSTVIGMCLNFAALHFVQEIDDIAFKLASQGFISDSVQQECKVVERYKTLIAPKRRTVVKRRVLLGFIAACMLVPWIFVVYRQRTGFFLCKVLHIQFDDAHNPDLELYSGIFEEVQGGYWLEERLVYSDETETIRLSYCKKEKAWVFSNFTSHENPCDIYIIKSSRTEGFDVMEIAGQGWSFHNPDTGEGAPLDWLAISCNDCEKNGELCQDGTCVDRKCECNTTRLGVNCEFPAPSCSYLYLDYETKASLAHVPGASVFLDNEYVTMKRPNDDPVKFNYRPVYIPKVKDNATFAFLVFAGRRWIVFGKVQEEYSNLTAYEIEKNVENIVEGDEHQHPVDMLEAYVQDLAPYKPLFFSAPVNFGTASDSAEPTNVEWVVSKHQAGLKLQERANDEKLVSAMFSCPDCNNSTNTCLNAGMCTATAENSSKCICAPSYHGPLCESAYTCQEKDCIFGGKCNPALNRCEECPEPYFGNLCQYSKDRQVDPLYCNKCRNNATCDAFREECHCPEQYHDEFCETFIPSQP